MTTWEAIWVGGLMVASFSGKKCCGDGVGVETKTCRVEAGGYRFQGGGKSRIDCGKCSAVGRGAASR